MSISKSLLRAAQIQEKIEQLRGQLSDLLDQARAEISAGSAEESVVKVRRGRPKALRVARGAGVVAASRTAKPKATARDKAARPTKRRRSPLAGQKRSSSPSGPLAPAVVKVLQGKKQPMQVRDILAGLLAGGYQFNSPEPRKNLAARIYRLKGVKQVSSGLFGVA